MIDVPGSNRWHRALPVGRACFPAPYRPAVALARFPTSIRPCFAVLTFGAGVLSSHAATNTATTSVRSMSTLTIDGTLCDRVLDWRVVICGARS